MGLLDFIFGNKQDTIKDFQSRGAIILDVRTKAEWNDGHIKTAIHIPLDELDKRVGEVEKLNKPIITCCRSGARSGKAANFLKSNNIEATNGGGWVSLKSKL